MARWISGGSEKSATDDGLGSLSGAATGRVVYGYADGSGAPQPGEAYVEFNGDAFPDASTLSSPCRSLAAPSRPYNVAPTHTALSLIHHPRAPIQQ